MSLRPPLRLSSAPLFLCALLVCSTACKEAVLDPSDESRVEQGSFLNEPAGVPPAVLYPSYAAISVHAASEIASVREVLNQHFGPEIPIHALDDESVRTFVQKYAAWYVPIDRLRAAVRSGVKTFQEVGAPVIPGVPALRAWVPIERLSSQGIHAVSAAGGRGMLTLWFPLMDIRNRLQDGAAGLWRGVTRMRDSLTDSGEPLGGTPVFRWAVVSTTDAQLLGADMPDPFLRRVDLGSLRPRIDSRRDGLVELLSGIPSRPQESDLPDAWRKLLSGPQQQPMVWFQPKSRSVPDRKFSDAIESLVPLVRQGAKVWIVLGLPLAQSYLPARH